MVIIGSILVSLINKPPPTPKKTTTQSLSEARATLVIYDVCIEKLEKAKELGMLSDVGVRDAMPEVFVGPTYFTVPIDEKKGFAEVVNCVLVKGTEDGKPFELIHWQTWERVATWNGYKLVMD